MLQEFESRKCQKAVEKLLKETMPAKSPMSVKDVNPQTLTESSGQLSGNVLQRSLPARSGRLKNSRKGFHPGKRASAPKMGISVDQETDYAELVLYVGEITQGEEIRRTMKDPQLRRREAHSISQAVCTLLNSGGGVVKAHIMNSNYSFSRDGVGLDLEDSFLKIVLFPQKYRDYMQNKGEFLIFVKPWVPDISGQRVLTLKTNFYVRNLSTSNELKGPDAVQFLRAKKDSEGRSCSKESLPASCDSDKCLATFFNREKLTLEETFCFTKSKHAEVKMSPKEKILEILPKTVSAFANTDGGYLFIGLDLEKEQIIGFEAEKADLEDLETEIEACIQELPVGHFCEEKQEKIKYTCKFIPVHRPGAACKYVCALRVERFCCAVFAEEPESWRVEDNCVKRFTSEEWVKLQMEATPGFFKQKYKQTLQSSSPPPCLCSCFAIDIPEAQQHNARLPVLARKVPCSPEGLRMELCSEHERYKQFLQTELGSLRQGTLIISESLALSLGLQKKQEVILDVLHISQDSLLTLHSFVRGEEELEGDSSVLRDLGPKLKNDCKQTALTLKQKLVNLGGFTGKIGVAIKITYLGHRAVSLYDSSSRIRYPSDYYLTTKTVRDLEKALAKVLGTVYQS
ncbi:schlafen family member 12-like [Microtus oregoni]|uniref:schlafen family member 12-like n=1 Tax=Microtus oregoni TaxID=111838 RepID=UPI001BB1C39C|nr:schlafen family member 12-like [Microtus oregoni]XP_041521311.1 schlafen family member 12-like [Microtus oregoni]